MYEIIGTEIEDGMRLIRVGNLHKGIEMVFYENEVKHIPCPDLNFLLSWNMWGIKNGVFDQEEK